MLFRSKGKDVTVDNAMDLNQSTVVYAKWTKDGNTVRTETLTIDTEVSQNNEEQGWSFTTGDPAVLTLNNMTINTQDAHWARRVGFSLLLSPCHALESSV